MARRYYRTSHSRGRKGKLATFFRRPVSHLVTPLLGGVAVAHPFLDTSANGVTAVDHLINYVTAVSQGQASDQLSYVLPSIEGGILPAAPWMIGAAVAAAIGRAFRI